ncbi:Alpha-glucosidase, glycosyl hydrolase family GH31 [Mucilaginibacter mallensis]|uniref:Alpha-glucosidase, glycosyl hydrolase family GH31 n=1 Tax=Mucilaginibacter mallensis TaxID=652787 RepID=A0A1H1QFC5_MUCMA|nr:TIM-barrel domain-containing protein [Mucilaginibacter mallensis]SDS22135.1 Alpha-glucosidase, glycosyl hydrolase family GH31 [Mucilaginibacter mallensis]
MKKLVLLIISLITVANSWAQVSTKNAKVFWKEDFNSSAGKFPDGWKNVDMSNTNGVEWIVTDQPYPGSYQYQQQAPPIASKSRGFYLQFQPGYMVDEDQPSWAKKKQYPDAWIQTRSINCSSHSSVILRFQQTFRYNDFNAAAGAGLYVGVSTDSLHWTDFDVKNNLPAAADMFNPINQEVNISKVAANQAKVFIRFYWKGYYSWYWMIDDISLAEGYKKDIAITNLTSNSENDNTFTHHDVLALSLKNTGIETISQDFKVTCLIDNKQTLTTTVVASAHPINPGEEISVKFPAADLLTRPLHSLVFAVKLDGDENPDNDHLEQKIYAKESYVGNVTGFKADKNEFDLSAGISKTKVIFYTDDIFRIWLAPDGEFTNPAGNDIVENYAIKNPQVKAIDKGTYYQLKSKECVLRVYKQPLRFALYDVTDTHKVWAETKPISFGAKTSQTMDRQPNEYFYGCGMQNGYFSHRDKDILIEKGNGWDDGGRANPAPFYMSTAGYGVFRNTFDVGVYSFKQNLKFTHNENRFDAFYFYGPSLKKILNGYTQITGRPFLMPRWALSLGDANCYNRGTKGYDTKNYVGSGINGTTPDVIKLVADKYVDNNMPRGWILPNDGYGCGYVKLDSTVAELHKRGFYTGLWTENGIDKIAREVGQSGTRLCKLDVAWVGPGYKFALDGCKAAYNGIENNSNARGFIWSVMGWAGTQKYSTVWSGDQSGNWEYIRFHIPTVIGSGLSAFNAATGDVDGIFRGSDSTYVRDLQWKCFTPVFMVMSGWAKKDKQPYIYGEPYTTINRKYLELKMRLTPYMYTYCAQAHETGVPTSRAMVLEFPNDPVTWGKQTQYQFMNGESFLVAPVYKSQAKRDSIYLPKGTWYDYWDGKAYTGNTWLNNYPAPLDKLPLFVKQGAIIPMYPAMNYDGEKRADSLTLEIYPYKKSSFNLYEDDGLTRDYREGAFAKTLIEVAAANDVQVSIHAAVGNYAGKYLQRVYVLDVHQAAAPKSVAVNGAPVKIYASADEFNRAKTGCYFDAGDKKGTVHIKTSWLKTDKDQLIKITN